MDRDAIQIALAHAHPMLALISEAATPIVEGILQIRRDSICLESFLVRVEFAQLATELPRAFEIGGRIPRKSDFHVNPDGSLCLGVPEQLWIEIGGTVEVVPFIDGPVSTFLLGASHKLRVGTWPHGERSHGSAGICEFYSDYVGTKKPSNVLALLRALQQGNDDRRATCVCGSGKLLRHCHSDRIQSLRSRNIPTAMLRRSIAAIERQLGLDGAEGIDAMRDRLIQQAVRRTLYRDNRGG